MRAWQTRRPCQMTRWDRIVHSRSRNEQADGGFDLHRIGLACPLPAAAQPAEVRVDRDAGDAEGVPEHHVGGFAAESGQGDEIGHPVGHLTVEPLDQGLTQLDQRRRLVSEEPGRSG